MREEGKENRPLQERRLLLGAPLLLRGVGGREGGCSVTDHDVPRRDDRRKTPEENGVCSLKHKKWLPGKSHK